MESTDASKGLYGNEDDDSCRGASVTARAGNGKLEIRQPKSQAHQARDKLSWHSPN